MFATPVLLLCSFLLHTGACLDPYDEVVAATKAHMEAIEKQDPIAAALIFATDCTFLTPTGEIVYGREGMILYFAMLMEAGMKGARFEHLDVQFSDDGEMGHFWSEITFLDADGDVWATAKSLVTVRREDGELKGDDVVLFSNTLPIIIASKKLYVEVEVLVEKFEEAWKNGDEEAMVEGMTKDAIYMMPGQDVAQGKEEVKEAMREIFDVLGETEVDYELEEVKLGLRVGILHHH